MKYRKSWLILLTLISVCFFAASYSFADCTYTATPSGWQFPYDNVAYRLQTSSTWFTLPTGHFQVQPTSSSWENTGSIKIFVNGSAVTLYSDSELTNNVGTNYDYYSGDGNLDFWFWIDFESNTEIKLKHWEANVGSSYEYWTINADCYSPPVNVEPTVEITSCPSGTLTSSSYTFSWSGSDSLFLLPLQPWH